MQVARGADPAAVGLPPLKKRIHKGGPKFTVTEPEAMPGRSDVAADNHVPSPPFWGTRIVRGVSLHDYSAFLDERATFMGQWGLKPGRGEDGASYEELVEREGRPRLRYWLDRILGEGMLDASVAYGYFPVVSEGEQVVVLHHGEDRDGVLGTAGLLAPDGGSGGPIGTERLRFDFPRQRRDRHLCLADFVRSRESGQIDVLPVQLVTAGSKIEEVTSELFAGEPLPRLLRAQRPGHAAHRGAGGILACAHPLGAGFRSRGAQGQGRVVQARLPRCAVLARIPRVPGHGGPPQGDGAAETRADGRGPQR